MNYEILPDFKLTKARVYAPELANRCEDMLTGDASGLLNWADTAHPEFYDTYMSALESHWTADEVNLTNDQKEFPSLQEPIRVAAKSIIGLLSGLDSAATRNLLEVLLYVKDPAIWANVAMMAKEEVEHNRSYHIIVSNVLSRSEEVEVFETPLKNELLLDRNKKMMDVFNDFSLNKTPDSMLNFLVHDTVLEGIFFYSGFAFFYGMARTKKLIGMTTEINYINRDEQRHTRIICDIYRTILQEHPELNTEERHQSVIDIFVEAVEKELAWCQHILAAVPGMDMIEIEHYLKYRANKIMSLLGYPKYFADVDENNILWIKRYEDNFDSNKTDFFEQKNRQYSKPLAINGFDEL